MNINIYYISKKPNALYEDIEKHFIKMTKIYAKMQVVNVYTSKLASFLKESETKFKEESSKCFLKFLDKNALNVALDLNGKMYSSLEFSSIISKNANVNFFIGSAFGLSKEFIKKCDISISFSNLTFEHKIAKIMLMEQVFRAYCIIHNKPYHK